MNNLLNAKDILSGSQDLPIRKGKRPVALRGPLHLQCSNHGDYKLLRQLVEEVAAWPGIESSPLPVASADLGLANTTSHAVTIGAEDGIYTRAGTGLTLGGGADIAAMRNENGVTIQLASTTEGLNFTLAVTGMKILIAD